MTSHGWMGPLAILAVSAWVLGACGGDSEVFGQGTGSGTSTGTGTGTGTGTTSSGTGGQGAGGSGGGTTSSGTGGSSSGTGGQGAGGSGIGAPCNWEVGGCDPGLYCDAPGCQDGLCQPILPPGSQSNHLEPVCGCDGVSYFNFSIAHSFGMAVSHAEACSGDEQVACKPDDVSCPDGRFCSRRVAGLAQCFQSPANVPGACWGLPDVCNTSDPNMPEGRPCAPGGQCQDICTLMKSEDMWRPENICF